MRKISEDKRLGWNTANPEFYKDYAESRRELLKSMTPAEKLLWERLKSKQLGVKFRRQHIIETFIPDFVALSIKLIIEVDGKIHLKRKLADQERTEILEMSGYKVIRFTNEDVENDIESVVEKIKNQIEILTPTDLSKGEK